MKKRSLFLLSLTAVIWGFSFTAQRLGADHVGVFTFDAVRFLLAGPFCPSASFWKRRRLKKA